MNKEVRPPNYRSASTACLYSYGQSGIYLNIRLQRQIDATDWEIDRLVYDLYGLTDEEIKVIEEGTGGRARMSPQKEAGHASG